MKVVRNDTAAARSTSRLTWKAAGACTTAAGRTRKARGVPRSARSATVRGDLGRAVATRRSTTRSKKRRGGSRLADSGGHGFYQRGISPSICQIWPQPGEAHDGTIMIGTEILSSYPFDRDQELTQNRIVVSNTSWITFQFFPFRTASWVKCTQCLSRHSFYKWGN